MKKHLLIFLLACALALMLCLVSCSFFIKDKEDEEEPYIGPIYPPSEGLEFDLSGDGTYYVLRGRGTCEDTRIVVPAFHEGKPVKAVAYCCMPFERDPLIEELVLTEGITHISAEAFTDCSNLTTVTIPLSLEEIGENAFFGAPIQNVYIKSLKKWLNVTGYINTAYRPDYYLKGELLVDLEIPGDIKNIKEGAFFHCGSIESVTMGNGIESVGDLAFYDCISLKNIEFPNTLKSIGFASFYSCDPLESVEIPDSVTTIAKGAFQDSIRLKRVTLGKNLQSIEIGAFSYCFSLFEVCNKSSLTLEMGSSDNGSVAYYARHITSDTKKTRLKNVGDYAFYMDGNDSCLLYYFGNDKDLVLPDIGTNYRVNTIAFAEISYKKQSSPIIESVVIPEYVTSIGDRAFYYCTNLKSVDIQGDIPSIREYTFYQCRSLESISLPDSVKSIGEYAFSGCESLTDMTVPKAVTSIGESAFSGCYNLKTITILGSVESIQERTFNGCSSLIAIKLPNSVSRIGKYAFAYCSSLVTINIPFKVKWIDDDAFRECNSLVEVFNESTLSLEAGKVHHGLVTLNAKNVIKDESESNLRYVGDYVFYDDGISVYLVKYLGNDAELILPEYENGGEYEINMYAFYNNDNIVSVEIPDCVTAIGYNAFYSCDLLKKVVVPASVVSIKPSVFEYSNLLTIYCEADERAEGWSEAWNYSKNSDSYEKYELPVVWGYKGD